GPVLSTHLTLLAYDSSEIPDGCGGRPPGPPTLLLPRALTATAPAAIPPPPTRPRPPPAPTTLRAARGPMWRRVFDDWRYVADMTISRCSAFRLQRWRITSVARKSSSSGCDGFSPCVPKSSSVGTMPRPKYFCHTQFASTRDVSGLSGATIHF